MPTLAPYEKPKLGLQDPAPITLEKVEWFIISKENIDVYLPLINAGTLTVVGITPTDYKHLSLNTQKLVNHIKEKNEIISAYRTYYENDK